MSQRKVRLVADGFHHRFFHLQAAGPPGNAFELVYGGVTDRVRANMQAADPVLQEWIRWGWAGLGWGGMVGMQGEGEVGSETGWAVAGCLAGWRPSPATLFKRQPTLPSPSRFSQALPFLPTKAHSLLPLPAGATCTAMCTAHPAWTCARSSC